MPRLAAFLLLAVAAVARADDGACVMSPSDGEWIDEAIRAWDLVREEALHLPEGERPPIVVFDARCRFETAGNGWSSEPHEGTIRLPDGGEIPAGVTSFTSGGEGRPPFFVMALPSIWEAANIRGTLELGTGLHGVFLHEYMHATQAPYLKAAFERLEALGASVDISDDSLQGEFGEDAEYVAAWERERDLLYAAALEPDACEAKRLAADALRAMKERQARWLAGESAVWKAADDLFVTMEGLGQWTAYAWLVHPVGAGLAPERAREGMRGSRWWSQDEGLALFLVIDRFLPGWQERAFGNEPKLGIELLEEVVEGESHSEAATKTFTHPRCGYSFRYPVGWNMTIPEPDTCPVVRPSDPSRAPDPAAVVRAR